MFSSLRRAAVVVLAASAALASCGAAPALASQPTMISAVPRLASAGKRSLFGARVSAALYGRKGARISVAQGKRNAAKARNVVRNRRHHR